MKIIEFECGNQKKKFEVPDFFIDDLIEFKRQMQLSKINFPIMDLFPIINEKFIQKENPEKHYFYQDLTVAQKIFKNNPLKHIDIGSRINGFVANVASFREIELFDIRDIPFAIPNVTFVKADLMNDLDTSLIDYCDSISSLHVLEHFGLGRYGDPISFEGYIAGLNNIYRILKKGGTFYFSAPIGYQQTLFNAHRIFSLTHLIELFDKKYKIESFSYENDSYHFFRDIELTEEMIHTNCGCTYGCGIFELIKI
ncbi:DUF268 domain-containing protein [Candidatus Desantisbacteria bacterium]|nr:DUF268 domain-containing protein [Candidatus Desantisbacteria bacterium]